jgi:hypothetical protein
MFVVRRRNARSRRPRFERLVHLAKWRCDNNVSRLTGALRGTRAGAICRRNRVKFLYIFSCSPPVQRISGIVAENAISGRFLPALSPWREQDIAARKIRRIPAASSKPAGSVETGRPEGHAMRRSPGRARRRRHDGRAFHRGRGASACTGAPKTLRGLSSRHCPSTTDDNAGSRRSRPAARPTSARRSSRTTRPAPSRCWRSRPRRARRACLTSRPTRRLASASCSRNGSAYRVRRDPAAIVARLNAEIKKALAEPDIRAQPAQGRAGADRRHHRRLRQFVPCRLREACALGDAAQYSRGLE